MAPEFSPRRRRRHRLPIVVFTLVLLLAGLGIVFGREALEPGAGDALESFLDDWSGGRDRVAGAGTDAPRAAAAALRANRQGLDGASLQADELELSEEDDRAAARVRLRWTVPGIGPWEYEVRVPLRRADGEWRVRWTPALVHPTLKERERSARPASSRSGPRSSTGGGGRSLVSARWCGWARW